MEKSILICIPVAFIAAFGFGLGRVVTYPPAPSPVAVSAI
jgi:hypothetical protein